MKNNFKRIASVTLLAEAAEAAERSEVRLLSLVEVRLLSLVEVRLLSLVEVKKLEELLG
jgi:hypothetical protein